METRAKKKRGRARAGSLILLLALLGTAVMVRAQAGYEVNLEPKNAADVPAATPAHVPDGCVTDSSKAEISVGLTYHGDIIEFFGTTGDTGADAVVVILRSPVEKVKLNQKGRVGPVWMSVKQHEVENVPFMYKIHASRPLAEIMSAEKAKELGIGFDSIRSHLKIHTIKGLPDPADEELIFNGLVKLKKKQNLYKVDDQERISIKGRKLFKHYFTFPAAAKEGDYIVDTFLFREGQLAGQSSDTINVSKVGLEAKIVRWANHYPKAYGIVAVLIALSTGLLVGNIFKGGAH
ncbi:MAG TPA: TIGR02186 family protein [bacterium]|nr:TIGR02186 family protein [bacterium]